MAVDIFMKIDDVEGESQDEKHTNEIQVVAWSWGLSQAGTMHIGTGGGAGKVHIQDLSFTKFVDKSTPTLIKGCTLGTHYKKAEMVCRKAGGKEALEYLKITMEGVLISSISEGGSGGEEIFTENITLNFEKVTVVYQPQDKTGAKKGGPVEMSYDIALAKVA